VFNSVHIAWPNKAKIKLDNVTWRHMAFIARDNENWGFLGWSSLYLEVYNRSSNHIKALLYQSYRPERRVRKFSDRFTYGSFICPSQYKFVHDHWFVSLSSLLSYFDPMQAPGNVVKRKAKCWVWMINKVRQQKKLLWSLPNRWNWRTPSEPQAAHIFKKTRSWSGLQQSCSVAGLYERRSTLSQDWTLISIYVTVSWWGREGARNIRL